jgi:hypothetical protein
MKKKVVVKDPEIIGMSGDASKEGRPDDPPVPELS